MYLPIYNTNDSIHLQHIQMFDIEITVFVVTLKVSERHTHTHSNKTIYKMCLYCTHIREHIEQHFEYATAAALAVLHVK